MTAAFRRFLHDPTPRERWVGKALPKNHPDWKPFTGTLSQRSVAYADTVCGHLFSYWLAQGYVRLNPYQPIPRLKHAVASGKLMTPPGLSLAQWQFMQRWLDDQVETRSDAACLAAQRLRLAMRLLYATGLRLHELAQAVREDVHWVTRSDPPQIWLHVVGKGGKLREVPLPPQVYQLLIDTHPRLVGRSWQLLTAQYPLIPPLRGDRTQALSPNALYKVLKRGFNQAAQALQHTDPVSAAHLQNASSHWLRHSHASHTLNHNVPLTVVRDNLGHNSLAVTSQYLHSDHDQRHQAISDWEASNDVYSLKVKVER